MNNPYSQADMHAVVAGVLANVLGIDKGDIAPSSAIVEELGADSLDFVELNTTLEKKLGMSMPKKGPLSQAGKATGTPDLFYSSRTGFTAAGVDLMKHCLSQYDTVKQGMTVHDVFNLTTVNNISALCRNLFDYLPDACPGCGHGEAALSPAGKAVCCGCSAVLRPLPGDEADELHIREYIETTSVQMA